MKKSLKNSWSSFITPILLATLLALPVYALTSVGTNISTDGNIIVNSGSGKAGIGTTTPSQLLSVQGNTLISGNLTSVANITATGTLNVTGLTTLGNASTTQIGSTGSAYFATTGGNVGIGTTTPVALLSVSGPSALAGSLSVGASYAGTAPPSNGAIIQGQVGIGTTSPAAGVSLDISHVGGFGLRIEQTSSAGGGFWNIGQTVNTYAIGGGKLIFTPDSGSSGNSVVVFSNSGPVGLGSLNPVNRLDVNGGVAIGAYAQTAAPSNGLIVSGNVGIGTTSPTSLLSVEGTVSATTTLHLGNKQSTTRGSCIQLYSTTGASYRLYVGTAGTLTTEAGACQ